MTLRPCAQLPELLVRPIRPDDKDALVAGLGRLSDRSVYQRFLAPKPHLTASELKYLTEVDFVDHYALVAVLARRPDLIVGVGRWIRDKEDPLSAEMAIVVADDLQGRGVGTTLGRWLARTAAQQGVTRFAATMLASNVAAHRLFAKVTQQLETTRRLGDVNELTAQLAAA